MTDIIKAHFSSDGDDIRFSMPIAKVDQERRIVSGFATMDNIDRQGDKLTPESSREAFQNFRGNVRLMHQPIPAGKVLSFRENSFYDPKTAKTYTGIFVDAYISKGADNIWQMVLDGTLTGFSIGGRIMDSEPMIDDESGESIRLVKKYELMELSLVDSPANQFANILSIQKVDDTIVTSGIATEFSVENVFWCESDSIATTSVEDSNECAMCGDQMVAVGWVEAEDENKQAEMSKMLEPFMSKSMHSNDDDEDEDDIMKETLTSDNVPSKNPTQGNRGKVSESMRRKKKRILKAGAGDISVGDFVAYAVNKDPQPTQYAKAKVESVRTSGRVRIKGTNEVLEASEKNPVMILRVYREAGDNKFVPTDRRVAKPVSGLRKLKPLMTKAASGRDSRLRELVTQHNEKYGNVNSKKVTLAMLRAVYNRGIGAYRTNPGSVRPNVASAEQWAFARVNGFLYAVRTGRFKRTAYDTDLLPSGHPLASKGKKSEKVIKSLVTDNEEGGVEVAENIEAQDNLEAAEAPVDTDEVEFEIEESIEEVEEPAGDPEESPEEAEAELALAKADGDVEVQAEDTSEVDFSLEKALHDMKEMLETTISKAFESKEDELSGVSDAISELVKSIDEKVGGLQAKYEEITKSLADLNGATEQLAARVETVEEDTAIKKSGELENSIPEQPIMRKSLWGGRFLNSAEIFN